MLFSVDMLIDPPVFFHKQTPSHPTFALTSAGQKAKPKMNRA
jgi:hypothetical protein